MNRLLLGLGLTGLVAAMFLASHRPVVAATSVPEITVAAPAPVVIVEETPAPRWGFTDDGAHRALDVPTLGTEQRAMIRRFVEIRAKRLARVPADTERLSDAFESAIVSMLTPRQLAIYRELLRTGAASLEMFSC